MTLHLSPAEIERKLLADLAMYEGAKYPNDGTRAAAEDCRKWLKALHDYQEGRIGLADLPLYVREMGWKMPEWGYRRD
jgi:hypothetical protein